MTSSPLNSIAGHRNPCPLYAIGPDRVQGPWEAYPNLNNICLSSVVDRYDTRVVSWEYIVRLRLPGP